MSDSESASTRRAAARSLGRVAGLDLEGLLQPFDPDSLSAFQRPNDVLCVLVAALA